MKENKLKFGIKNKSLLFFSMIFLILIFISIYIGISSLYEAKKSTIKTGNELLINQTKEFYLKYTHLQKETLKILIKNIEADVYNLQDFTKKLYLNKDIIDTRKYWNYKEHLIHLPNNQLTEKTSDISTLWTPTWMKVDERVLKKIEISSYLNEYFEPLLNRNINTVANYFLGTEGFLRYYPRVNMLELFPSDFRTIDDIYFLPATPKFNPEKKLLWTPLYQDPAEQGLMISAIAPVYVNDNFIGVVGTDLTLKNLLKNLLKENEQGYSILLDSSFKPIALSKNAINEIYKKNNIELSNKTLLDYKSNFKKLFKEINKTESGFERIVLNNKEMYISFSKLNDLGWIYADILYADEIFKVTKELSSNIDSIINKSVEKFLLPLILFFVIFAFIISMAVNKFLMPLIELSDITKIIARGDITKKIKLESKDEIGILISNFKVMQKSIIKQQKKLNKFNDNLKQEVFDRTVELEESNDELEETISNLKQTQSKLIESEKMASLGGLVAGVAHEINTPVGIGLTGISYLVDITDEIILKYNNNDMTKEEFEEYLEESKDIQRQINTNLIRTAALVRSFKQTSVDQTHEEIREFYLKEYISGVLLSISNITKKTNININVDCDTGVKIKSYPGAFSQIISNLVINSVRHGFKEKEKGKINISIVLESNSIKLIYKDNGKGIPKENINKIFEPFFTTNREHGGTGLGLNIIYNIVTSKLKGTINCHSEENKGIEFVVILPFL